MRKQLLFLLAFLPGVAFAQLRWQNVDSAYGPLPKSMHLFFTDQPIDTAAFRAFYLVVDLKEKSLRFDTDTTVNRRLTPAQFFDRNGQPPVVVNGTFFSFETNRNLNVVVKEGKVVAYNPKGRSRRDTLKLVESYKSAIGITKKRNADVAWIRTDSSTTRADASQLPINAEGNFFLKRNSLGTTPVSNDVAFSRWKVETAIGGGPVLLQEGEIKITNDIERRFAGKNGLLEKHPRTAMGYTSDQRLIILVIEGRNPQAGGATLEQEATILQELGCVEALNLDGGGSSCLLVNGKETIRPAGDGKQRPVPAVFLVRKNEK